MTTGKERNMFARVSRISAWYMTSEWGVYIRHCVALVIPTSIPKTVPARHYSAGDIGAWPDSSLELLIQEGRRQNDLQRSSLHHLQSRSQFIFTTGIATMALVGATFSHATSDSLVLGLWSVAILVLLLGMLGSAANLGAREGLRQVDVTDLSRKNASDLKMLATEYLKVVKEGSDTAATRYILYRKSALLQLPGSLILLTIWIIMLAGQ